VRDSLDSLRQALGSTDAPIVIVAHSLGCHVLSNYIWDAQRRTGFWKDKAPTPFQRLDTAAYFFTAGCNIPLFVSGLSKIEAIEPPNKDFQWINFYDRDDILGWPLKPLGDGGDHSYGRVVTQDVAINVGWGPLSMTPLSHSRYWRSRSFLKPVAEAITRLHSRL
jgi:hypothetical protein